MKIELEYCEHKVNDAGFPMVEFGYFYDDRLFDQAQVIITYEKLYPVADESMSDLAGIAQWTVSISAGGDLSADHCTPVRWAAVVAAVALYHDTEEHQAWVLSGRSK